MMDFQSIVILIGLILALVWIFNRKKTSKDNYCFDCKRPAMVKRRIDTVSVLASILTFTKSGALSAAVIMLARAIQ